MKTMEELEKRMYIFVPYNLSPIQQAIQAGHAVEQYARTYRTDPFYIDYVENHKTWIVLNGGTTSEDMIYDEKGNLIPYGTVNQIREQLYDNNIKFAEFHEPDLDNALTAVCFVADERVFNYKDYPDWDGSKWWEKDTIVEPFYSEWIEELGGTENVFLRKLLKGKRLA